MLLLRLQRLTAILLVPFLAGHLVITLALGRSEMTAAQLLAQAHANPVWLLYYSVLLVLVAVHAPIGFWHVLRRFEAGPTSLKITAALLLGLSILVLGARALTGFYL